MCGIVGYVGGRDSVPLIVSSLKKLEYRGYDSAGVAVVHGGGLEVVRAVGKLRNLEERLRATPIQGSLGLGHTRWATHGRPSDENAHPHSHEGVAVVHNGIIENHLSLRTELLEKGHTFSSQTDTEVLAHLVSDELKQGRDLVMAVRATVARIAGTYSFAVIYSGDPTRIVCAKTHSPMVIGLSEGQSFLASDVPALLEHTRDCVFLEDGDLAVLTASKVELFDHQGRPLVRPARRINWTPLMAEKGGHKHFMHKEICEQPRAVADTIAGRVLLSEGDVHFDDWTLSPQRLQGISRVVLLGCGTSWHAGLVGKVVIEALTRVPVEVELASEFRYRDPLVGGDTLVVGISQSGETADTLAALKEAKRRGAPTIALCNVMGSAMTREAESTVLINAGLEIGVAATKTFTAQLTGLFLLAVKLGRRRGLEARAAQEYLAQLLKLPGLLETALRCEPEVEKLARELVHSRDALFLGRGAMYPIALEGALKLKEISYIHAEGYAGGEMKHGPIALIDEAMPVVVLAPREPRVAYDKILGNIEEVRARGGKVIAVINDDDAHVRELSDHTLPLPPAPPLLMPMVATVPLQLLAYHVADLRGTDVDQPRNLAKSVTVE